MDLEKNIFIDFDGVILDTVSLLRKRKEHFGFYNHHGEEDYLSYFALADTLKGEWEHIIMDAKPINNSVEIIKELERLKKKIIILTKVHSLIEMQLKVKDLRENRGINSPIMFVPKGVSKHEVVMPNKQILIDDQKRNINEWTNNGGIGYLFDDKISCDTDKKVRSLEFLLDM